MPSVHLGTPCDIRDKRYWLISRIKINAPSSDIVYTRDSLLGGSNAATGFRLLSFSGRSQYRKVAPLSLSRYLPLPFVLYKTAPVE